MHMKFEIILKKNSWTLADLKKVFFFQFIVSLVDFILWYAPHQINCSQCMHMNTAALCVSAVGRTACCHHSFDLADKKQSPDWDFAIVFSDKAYGLTVNTKGLTDNFHLDQV